MPYWEATFDKETFGFPDLVRSIGYYFRGRIDSSLDAFTPPVARTDDGDRRPAAVRPLAQPQAAALVDDPECPSPAKGASCSGDSNPRRTGRAGRAIPRYTRSHGPDIRGESIRSRARCKLAARVSAALTAPPRCSNPRPA